MLHEVYGTITKKSLLDKANMVKERFNNANFKTKSTNLIQHINKVEVIEHGMAVYFWCSHMNNMDICKLNSKSVIATYSFRYSTMTLFKRKVLQGAVSLEDMIKENERRGYNYD